MGEMIHLQDIQRRQHMQNILQTAPFIHSNIFELANSEVSLKTI